MMICKADFEDLFPSIFPPEQPVEDQQAEKPQDAGPVARHDNRDGQVAPEIPLPQSGFRLPVQYGHVMPDLGRYGVVAASMPAAAAYGAALNML